MNRIYKTCFLLLIITRAFQAFSQNLPATEFDKRPERIDEVVKQINQQTFKFYYNNRWQLVKPICNAIERVSKVDSITGSFSGKFTDKLNDSTLIVSGEYQSGLKEGLFTIYYLNGQLEQTGYFTNNNKSGIWEYYYPNGKKWQILKFIQDETLIIDFWNKSGKQLINFGNGTWIGFEDEEKFTKTTGAVLNGRKTGVWKKTIPAHGITMNIENYTEGKLISGKMFSKVNLKETYSDKIYCTIDRPLQFVNAENFQLVPCSNETIVKRVFPK